MLPLGIDIDSSDNIGIVDQGSGHNTRIHKRRKFHNKEGNTERSARNTEVILEDIEIDAHGDVFITDRGNHKVLKLSK